MISERAVPADHGPGLPDGEQRRVGDAVQRGGRLPLRGRQLPHLHQARALAGRPRRGRPATGQRPADRPGVSPATHSNNWLPFSFVSFFVGSEM